MQHRCSSLRISCVPSSILSGSKRRCYMGPREHLDNYVRTSFSSLGKGRLTMENRSAEHYGTLIVSCAPALSSFWHNVFIKTRLYSTIRSTLCPQRNSKQSKILEDQETPQGGSESCLPHRNENHRDPYPITDADFRSQQSAPDTVSSRPSSGFITSAIMLTTHIETRNTLR